MAWLSLSPSFHSHSDGGLNNMCWAINIPCDKGLPAEFTKGGVARLQRIILRGGRRPFVTLSSLLPDLYRVYVNRTLDIRDPGRSPFTSGFCSLWRAVDNSGCSGHWEKQGPNLLYQTCHQQRSTTSGMSHQSATRCELRHSTQPECLCTPSRRKEELNLCLDAKGYLM